MEKQTLEDVCELTGYAKGTLPFRYLGVPISSKKNSAVDCDMLVDKLTCRVKTWGTRNLSYAGRTQLVNSVLMHIHVYWSTIFLLPKKVMKSITVVCRNFLWSGQIHTSKAPLIAWEVVCQSKKEGGLGITECIGWNEAAIAKYVWNVENKTDNIWVKWVHQIYIKGADWWQYQPQAESCWYWRKICSIKGKFAAGYSGNKWLHSNGEYTIQSGYRWKSGNGNQWPWWRDTWNKMNVPKHSFICWLAMHRRLLTRDRLARMGVCQETECLLCGCKPENIDHLFFECDYSKKCLEGGGT